MRQIHLQQLAPYIDAKVIDVLYYLKGRELLNRLTICGSLGLVLNSKLERIVKDVDILTKVDWYGTDHPLSNFRDSDVNEPVSHQFILDGIKITCLKVRIFDTKIDILYNPKQTKGEEVELITEGGISIKVRIEDPEVALSFKQKYIVVHKTEESRGKHLNDINMIKRRNLIDEEPYWDKTVLKQFDPADDLPF